MGTARFPLSFGSGMRHVIIGSGPAGVVAAETLRRLDPSAEITVIGDKTGFAQSTVRTASRSRGALDETPSCVRSDADHLARLRIELRHSRVKAIDTAACSVTLADGRVVPYDRALIATGSRPVRPAIVGIDLPQVFTCWTPADAQAIAAVVSPAAHVLQMGAGFIGCIAMQALAAHTARLTVVEVRERMLAHLLDDVAGGLIRRWCEDQGVRICTGRRVVAVTRSGERLRAEIDDGEIIEADVLINATGGQPNVAFLAGSGIALDRGVLVDAAMQSSVAGVYAAGDAAEAIETGTRRRRVNAIQPDAVEQARIAALNMAGHPALLPGTFAYNILDTLGLVSASFGQWQEGAGGETAQLLEAADYRYLRLVFSGDRLLGANSVGYTEQIAALRGLIQERVSLGEWKERLSAAPLQVTEAYLARRLLATD
ncbi:FAD-dependent oxidoreductase [Accumulibacter sp.]|uniref:NAD(P)/FAD-dependent oxidoreductase n=1 Tax=Accumulibacter sp. TaxID=2053492 RepID=UPI002BA1D1E6|nr:FAD-dependent oxidoreductase [Accumulibacter sp.]HNB68408.1 FAD-dependent oxidoreductase [Accumulibacter sp.]